MLRTWTKILPFFIVEWLANKLEEIPISGTHKGNQAYRNAVLNVKTRK